MTRRFHSGDRASRAAFQSISWAEVLERRVLLSTYLVTNTNDSGTGSLRQAILDADAGPASVQAPQIQFKLGPGALTIRPISPLPVVTRALRIGNGPTGEVIPPPPTVELDGSQAGPFASGLVLGPTAAGAEVAGMIIDRFAKDGVDLQGDGQGVFDSYIGLDPTGTVADGNRQFGILITGPMGTGLDEIRNDVISGNGSSGILITGEATSVSFSAVGTNAFSTAAIGNGTNPNAVYRDGITALSPGTVIGGGVNPSIGTLANTIVSGNHGNGIFVGAAAGSGVKITSCAIGTDASGSIPIPNAANGIVLANSGTGVQVGMAGSVSTRQPFPTAYGGNVIAANGGDGVLVLSSGNSILGNYIGANIVGAPLGNLGNGVEVRGGDNNTISGDIVAANSGAGISIRAEPANSQPGGGTGNTVVGCEVGLTPRLTLGSGNLGNGIEVFASQNLIGGKGARNTIARNLGSGIYLGDADGIPQSGNSITSNLIGTAILYAPSLGNIGDGITIYRSSNNSIVGNTVLNNGGNGVTVTDGGLGGATGNTIQSFEDVNNAGLGIDLGDDGVTPNHPGGSTTGPNHFQNYPVFTSVKVAVNGGQSVGYTFDAAPGSYTIDFYDVRSPDPSGYGQDDFSLGQQTITIAAGPPKTYFMTLSSGGIITATATDAAGNTSEFAKDFSLIPPQLIGQPTFDPASQTVTARFTEDVSSSLTPASLRVINTSLQQVVVPTGVSYDAATNTATFALPQPLSGGFYWATLLSSQISNALGVPFVNPNGTNNYMITFTYLGGDLNGDKVVDFRDLVILAAHYNQNGGYSAGDLNGDGKVNLADLVLLAQDYGHRLGTAQGGNLGGASPTNGTTTSNSRPSLPSFPAPRRSVRAA